MKKIFILGNHNLCTKVLRDIIDIMGDGDITGSNDISDAALSVIEAADTDLVVLFPSFQKKNDHLGFIKKYRKEFPSLPIVIMASHIDEDFFRQVFNAGVWAYLTLDDSIQTIRNTFHCVYAGIKYISPEKAIKIIDRKYEVEDELKNRARGFQSIVEKTSDYICRHDLDMGLIYASPSYLAYMQNSMECVAGKRLSEIFPRSEYAKIVEDRLAAIIATEKIIEEEVSIGLDSNGEPLWGYMKFIPEYDQYNNFKSILFIGRNISSKKSLMATFKEREKRYQEIFNNTRDFLFLVEVTPEREFLGLEINTAVERATGMLRESIIGKNIDEILPPDLSKKAKIEFNRCLEEGYAVRKNIELEQPYGKKVYSTRIIPVRDETGRIYRLTGISSDVTENEQRKQEIQLLGFALDNIHEAAFLFDENCNIDYINDKACRSLGYTCDEMEKIIVSDFDPLWSREKWNAFFPALKKKGNEIIASYHMRKDKSRFPVEISATYMEFNGRGNILALVRDKTEQRQVEMELIEQERKFRNLAENLPDTIIRYDKKGRAVYLNENLIKVLGKPAGSILGKTPLERCNSLGYSKKDYYHTLMKVLKNGESENLEISWETMFEKKIIQIRFIAERNDEGKIIGAMAIGNDITEQKKIEKALIDSENKYKSILQEEIVRRNEHIEISGLDQLTKREEEVFRYIGQGLSYIEIARKMDISENTVNTHKANIKKKLKMRSSTDILYIAMQYVLQYPS